MQAGCIELQIGVHPGSRNRSLGQRHLARMRDHMPAKQAMAALELCDQSGAPRHLPSCATEDDIKVQLTTTCTWYSLRQLGAQNI